MTYCQYCGEAAGSLPFKCNYCGGTFCGSHRLPENHECTFDENYQYQREREREQRKKRTRARWNIEKDLGPKGMRSTIGTSSLYMIIISMSILGIFFPTYVNITLNTFFSYSIPFIWTYFTSMFVVPITNVIELCYFLVLMFFSVYFVRTFENKYGPKKLLITYIASAGILVLVQLYTGSIFFYYGYIMYLVKIGLAPAGLIGILFVILLDNSKRSWYFRNIQLKAVTVLVVLIVMSIASKVVVSMIAFEDIPSFIAIYYYSGSVGYYMIDLIGPIVVIIIAGIYYQSTKGRYR
jgi:hypothetical protein